jgi:predicted DCC family thiol-disulfide oxidoreductase YuxK
MTRADPALAYPLTVYYDASCPLCRAEIETLKSRDADGLLYLVDCSSGVIAFEDVTQAQMMARIHARDAAGRWLRGMDVFAAVYRAAGLWTLARLYASRWLRPLFDRLYPWIADNRRLLSRLGFPRLFRLVAPGAAKCAACVHPPDSPPG